MESILITFIVIAALVLIVLYFFEIFIACRCASKRAEQWIEASFTGKTKNE